MSGSNLFVANYGSGTIGEYTTSGATVNAALVSGLNEPFGIAVSGSNLFVANRQRHDWRIHHVGGNGQRRPDLRDGYPEGIAITEPPNPEHLRSWARHCWDLGWFICGGVGRRLDDR